MRRSGSYHAPPKLAALFREAWVPFDPQKGRHLSLGFDEREIREFTVISECTEGENIYDCLLCHDRRGRTVYVAKPFMLQRTPFDGQTVDDVSYTYSTAFERQADGVEQVVSPAYLFDGTEKILAGRVWQRTMKVGGHKVEWVDLNTSGRDWLVAAAGEDIYAKVSSNDTISNYLRDKITTSGASISSSISNPAGNESLDIVHEAPNDNTVYYPAGGCPSVCAFNADGHCIGWWDSTGTWQSPWGISEPA